MEWSSTTSSVTETQAGEEAVKGIVCLTGWSGSGGDATGSCVVFGTFDSSGCALYTIGSGML